MIKSFWALLERGIISQYHKVSIKYLPKYIDEFSYSWNYRDDDNLWPTTIANALMC
ncbi:MAG: transposase [Desulfobacterales bacterium]|nr:transposase [Desulfobacterales bacterium]